MAEILAFLATAALGLLAGAMLLIAVAIAPFWAALEPTEFARWFRDYSPLLGRIMVPLGASSTILVVLAAWRARAASSRSLPWLAVAALARLALGHAVHQVVPRRLLLSGAPQLPSDSWPPSGRDGILAPNPGLSAVATSNGRLIGAVLCGHDGKAWDHPSPRRGGGSPTSGCREEVARSLYWETR